MVVPGSPFDLSDPLGQVLAVVLFLVPGLNCTWAVERLAGRTPLGATERLVRAVSLSLLIYLAASPWLVRLVRRASDGSLWASDVVKVTVRK